MPIYEFVCTDCRKETELLLRNGELPLCESCGSGRLEKLLTIPAAHSTTAASEARTSEQGPPAGSCGTGCGCFPG